MRQKIEALNLSIVEMSGKKHWKLELSIPRPFPLNLIDHRPWEKFPRNLPPVRTFIGYGMCWGELTKNGYMAAGALTATLNAFVSDQSLAQLSFDRAIEKFNAAAHS